MSGHPVHGSKRKFKACIYSINSKMSPFGKCFHMPRQDLSACDHVLKHTCIKKYICQHYIYTHMNVNNMYYSFQDITDAVILLVMITHIMPHLKKRKTRKKKKLFKYPCKKQEMTNTYCTCISFMLLYFYYLQTYLVWASIILAVTYLLRVHYYGHLETNIIKKECR